MRKSVHLWMALVALGIVFGCAGVSFGQDDDNPPTVGGYSKVATNDAGVEAAAEFAVSEQKRRQGGPLSLTEIKRAESQSVAGTNYRLCLGVKAGDETDAGVEAWDVEAVVFEKLPRAPGNKYKLTSWVKKDCGGSDSEQNHFYRPATRGAGLYKNGSLDLTAIQGTVTESGSGEKLDGVEIKFEGTRNGRTVEIGTATSRDKGYYYLSTREFAFFQNSTIKVTASLEGYKTWSQEITLDGDMTINIELTPK